MSFMKNKYKFITHDLADGIKETIAISYYKGRVVKGRAKCDPRDEFNQELRETYAALRCNLKVAQKRVASAKNACAEVENLMEQLEWEKQKAEQYLIDAEDKLSDAEDLLADFEDKLE